MVSFPLISNMSRHVWQIRIKACTALQMALIGFQPKTTLHKDLAQRIIVAPKRMLVVANSGESVVCIVNVICKVGCGERRTTPCLKRRAVWRSTYNHYRTLVWEIFRDVDTQSVASPVICVDMPVDSSVAS